MFHEAPIQFTLFAQDSADTKNPVRVVRGFKNCSQYGPEEGLVRGVAGVQRYALTNAPT